LTLDKNKKSEFISIQIMKFYADENFPLPTVKELRNLGHDVLTIFDDDRANQEVPDDEVLARATELKMAILTHNRLDFKRLHARKSDHFGIVICTENKDSLELARLIQEKVSAYESLEGELIRIYRPDK
jgi:predicted nuclease of predicted toxin-antitoxin system